MKQSTHTNLFLNRIQLLLSVNNMFEQYGIVLITTYLTYLITMLNVMRFYSITRSVEIDELPVFKTLHKRVYSVIEWAIVALPTMLYTYSNNIENVLGLTCSVVIVMHFAESMLDEILIISHIMTLVCYVHTNYILCCVFFSI